MTSGKKKLTITITLAVALGILIFVFQLMEGNQPRIAVKDIPAASPVPVSAPATAENLSLPNTHSILSQSSDQPVVKIAPKPEAIRKEVEKDPHHTPKSVLEFASELGERMDQATQSNEAASRFFTELSDCVNSSEFKSAPTIRAICLSNARLLTQRVPELEPNFQQLYDNTDSEITNLVH